MAMKNLCMTQTLIEWMDPDPEVVDKTPEITFGGVPTEEEEEVTEKAFLEELAPKVPPLIAVKNCPHCGGDMEAPFNKSLFCNRCDYKEL